MYPKNPVQFLGMTAIKRTAIYLHECEQEVKHMESKSRRLVPDSKVCQRYGVVSYTLWRWDHKKPELGFPKPVWINGRKHRFEDELDEFDARLAAERDAEVSAA